MPTRSALERRGSGGSHWYQERQVRPGQGGGWPGVGSCNGSNGRIASQRKSSTKLGMSKRRSAAGMERISTSSERVGFCSRWNGLSGTRMAGTRGAHGIRSLFIGASAGGAARCGSGIGPASKPDGYPVRSDYADAWTELAAAVVAGRYCATAVPVPG